MLYKDLPSNKFLEEKTNEYTTEMNNYYHTSEILPLLSKFQCPATCTQCCKTLNPSVSFMDIHKITKSHPLSIPLCSTLKVQNNGLISLGSPCTFLYANCSIYPHRPIPCQVYPFVFRESLPDHVQLMPCPLGIQIINHIFPTVVSEYFKIHEERGSSEFVKNAFLNTSKYLLSNLNEFHSSNKFFKTKHGADIPCLQLLKSTLPKLQ